MNESTKAVDKQYHKSQDIIETSVREALFVAEFFANISGDTNMMADPMLADSPIAEQLRTAEKLIDMPLGLNDLIIEAHFGGKRHD